MDNNIDNFKYFVKNNPFLIGYIRRGEKSWQEFYEIYDLYGEDEDAWSKFLSVDKERDESFGREVSRGGYLEEIINMAKRVDMDKVQEGISSLQKTLGLFGELFVNKEGEKEGREYNPRPLYRRFDD